MNDNNTERKAPLIWIMAGESSGDLYGARIASEIRKIQPDAVIQGMGGVKMNEAGVDILVDSSELGVIGVVDLEHYHYKYVLNSLHPLHLTYQNYLSLSVSNLGN